MKLYTILPTILQSFVSPFAKFLFVNRLSLKISGLEHVRAAKHTFGTKLIFASTHPSDMDAPIIIANTRRIFGFTPVFPVSKTTHEFFNDTSGWRKYLYSSTFFLRSMGAYPIVRGAHDYSVSLANHTKILEDGYPVLIFPESRDKNVNDARGGVIHLSVKTTSPIIPCHISLNRLPVNLWDLLMRRSRGTLSFGPAIHPDDLPERIKDESEPEYCKRCAVFLVKHIHTL